MFFEVFHLQFDGKDLGSELIPESYFISAAKWVLGPKLVSARNCMLSSPQWLVEKSDLGYVVFVAAEQIRLCGTKLVVMDSTMNRLGSR